MNMTQDDVRKIADAAAEQAVKKVLISLGADPDDPHEMQRDFQFIRSWRNSSETVKRQGLLTATGVIVLGMLGLIWLAATGGPK